MKIRRMYLPLMVLVGLGLIGLLFSLVHFHAGGENMLKVSYINVGQGDSALIQDPDGFDVLVDGGKPAAGSSVAAYVRQQGVDDIDVMLVTHADADHVGGLIDVLNMNDIPVRQVLYNGYPGTSDTWNTFATAVAEEGLALEAAQFPLTYTWGATTAYILGPVPGLNNPETNDASIVFLLDYMQNKFLFTGDIDTTIEATVMARGTPVAADVLKVAHHGSAYGSSAAFLAAIKPHDAVISVGQNSYGHPSPDTLVRLADSGAQVWRTDQSGTIVVESNGVTYQIQVPYKTILVMLPVVLRQNLAATPPASLVSDTIISLPANRTLPAPQANNQIP